METTRRGFLKLFGAGAAVATAAAVLPEIVLAEPEPVRRYFDMGRGLRRGGLQPVDGYPGMFRDSETGVLYNMRDWHEQDKYDTIVVPSDRYDVKHFIHDEYIVEPKSDEFTVDVPAQGMRFENGVWKPTEETKTMQLLFRSHMSSLVTSIVR